MVASVTDNEDPNPTVTATLDGQTITYDAAYKFVIAGNSALRITAKDKAGNTSFADITLSI